MKKLKAKIMKAETGRLATVIFLCGLCFLLFNALPARAQTNLGQVHLQWYYNSNALVASATDVPWFYIRATNSLAGQPGAWPVIYAQPWTNTAVTNFDGTNLTFAISYQVTPPGQMFFVATASNFWGESGLSNTSATPPVASVLKTQIFKN